MHFSCPVLCHAYSSSIQAALSGTRKGEGKGSFVKCPCTFWDAQSSFVMCFSCQGREKMSEQVLVCCWAAANSAPFSVTRHCVTLESVCCLQSFSRRLVKHVAPTNRTRGENLYLSKSTAKCSRRNQSTYKFYLFKRKSQENLCVKLKFSTTTTA